MFLLGKGVEKEKTKRVDEKELVYGCAQNIFRGFEKHGSRIRNLANSENHIHFFWRTCMGKTSSGRHERQFVVFKASVLQWYTQERWDAVFPYITGEKYSRRFIEHFTTEFARSHKCEYTVTDGFTGEVFIFNVYHSAQTVLAGVHKRNMDPFGRRNKNAENNGKFTHGFGDKKALVSVCELIFFRWWLDYKVGDYVDAHFAEISADMSKLSKVKRGTTKKKQEDFADTTLLGEIHIEMPTDEARMDALLALPLLEQTPTGLPVQLLNDVNPFHDEYWKSSVADRMQHPKKRRKRYRESKVNMALKIGDVELQAAI